jgi:hypothetical protein
MGIVQTISGRDASGLHWLPCVKVTLNDQLPWNGWLVICHDDGFDPTVCEIVSVCANDWVDCVVHEDRYGDRYSYLFLPVTIDPSDMPEI